MAYFRCGNAGGTLSASGAYANSNSATIPVEVALGFKPTKVIIWVKTNNRFPMMVYQNDNGNESQLGGKTTASMSYQTATGKIVITENGFKHYPYNANNTGGTANYIAIG